MGLVNQYLKQPKPLKSNHLWRYTSWSRMHPLGEYSQIPEDVSLPTIKLTYLDGTIPEGFTIEQREHESEISELEPDVSASFIRAICAGKFLNLEIPKGAVFDKPILIDIHVTDKISALNLKIDNFSMNKLELITKISGDAEWFGLLREGELGKNSKLKELFVNKLDSNCKFLRSENFYLFNDAKYESATMSLGGFRCKSDIRAVIKGQGVDYNQKVAIHGRDKRNDDIHLRIFHEAKNSNSRVIAHTICDDSSRNTITGKLIINKEAQNTDAGQKFLNLLLSEDSKVNSIPELEVLANEVSAAHGASSAPINKEQLFYMRSRGLSLDEAKAMIIDGFLMSTFQNFSSNKLVEYCKSELEAHLN